MLCLFCVCFSWIIGFLGVALPIKQCVLPGVFWSGEGSTMWYMCALTVEGDHKCFFIHHPFAFCETCICGHFEANKYMIWHLNFIPRLCLIARFGPNHTCQKNPSYTDSFHTSVVLVHLFLWSHGIYIGGNTLNGCNDIGSFLPI